MKEENIEDADVKKAFDEANPVNEELGGDQPAPSADKKLPSASSSEDVKSVTEEEETEDVDDVNGGKPVPYSRFKEAQEQARKAKEYEEFLSQNSDMVKRDPVTNRLVRITKEEVKTKNDDDLTDEDLLAFDEHQLKVIEKLTAKREREAIARMDGQRRQQEETSNWWNKTKEEFPDVTNKDSELYKKADEIFTKQYVKFGPGNRTWYAEPNSHYLAVLQADREMKLALKKKEDSKSKSVEDEKKNNKQNTFVEKTSKTAPKVQPKSDKELETMSRSELDDLLEKEMEKSLESL